MQKQMWIAVADVQWGLESHVSWSRPRNYVASPAAVVRPLTTASHVGKLVIDRTKRFHLPACRQTYVLVFADYEP